MNALHLKMKVDAYKYAIEHNNKEWANSVLCFLEQENYHKLIPLLQNKKFEEAKTLANSYFK